MKDTCISLKKTQLHSLQKYWITSKSLELGHDDRDSGGWNTGGNIANAFDEVSSVSDSDASRLDEENELDSLLLLGIQFQNDCGLYCGPWHHCA